MPNVVKIGDMASGHSCWPPHPTLTGSFNVKANGLGVHRIGDHIAPHCCGVVCHPSMAATGSTTVKANGIPITRVGDMANCGSVLVTGSFNVIINDAPKPPKPVNKLPEEYNTEAVQALSIVAGYEAAYDDEDSIGNIPSNQYRTYNNETRDPITDPNSLGSSGNSAIANKKPNIRARLDKIIVAMNEAGIKNHSEQAMLLAQLDHESAGFAKLSEGLYSADGVWKLRGSTLSKYGVTLQSLYTEQSSKGKIQMYEFMYLDKYRDKGFKMGNISDGDGIKYKGRGYIQLTGKALYVEFSKLTKLDLTNSPELAEQEDTAIEIAIQYWISRGCRTPAQKGDVETVTRKINGGLNGLDDRKRKYYDYLTDANNGEFDMPKTNTTPTSTSTSTTQERTDVSNTGLVNNPNLQLSPNFTLGKLSSLCIFPHKVKAQGQFTEQQIIYNLKMLATNVLEKIWAKYPNFRVNSGFRTFTKGVSQHEKGQAADLQWPGISNLEYLERAKWIRANITYDQLLFEHGNTIWIHVSFDPNKKRQRLDCKTMYRSKFTNGLTLYYK